MSETDERAAFEAWVTEAYGECAVLGVDGGYEGTANEMYEGWKARAALADPPEASEVEKMAREAGLIEEGWHSVPIEALSVLANLVEAAAMERAAKIAEGAWSPIETCPQDGYFLVHEDEAIRLLLRIGGEWHNAGYPALVTTGPRQDVVVGQDAERVLTPLGYRLEHRDGCCENPTHWMPCPDWPKAANLKASGPDSQPGTTGRR